MKILQNLKRFRNTRIEQTGPAEGVCFLHDHPIVLWSASEIRISLCGWNTYTTRRRINQCLEALGHLDRVYQEKSECFLYHAESETSELMDNHRALYVLKRVDK